MDTVASLRRQLKQLHKLYTYREIADVFERFKDIPPGTLSDISNGKPIPEHYHEQLQLRSPNVKYTRKRREKLNQFAQDHGWNSWSEYETAVANGDIEYFAIGLGLDPKK